MNEGKDGGTKETPSSNRRYNISALVVRTPTRRFYHFCLGHCKDVLTSRVLVDGDQVNSLYYVHVHSKQGENLYVRY